MKQLQIGFSGNGKSANRYRAPFIATLPEQFAIRKKYFRDHAEISGRKLTA